MLPYLRRKQKHPRPISSSSEGGEMEEVGNSPTRDLSDLVKVEIHQTEEETETTERRPSPTSPRSNNHGLPFPPMEDLMRKCNLVPFGEVTIQNHPNTPPIPMTIPITYLFPISKDAATGEAKYKMLVPRNGAEMGMGFPPMIPFPSPPLMPQMVPPPNFRPEEMAAEQQKQQKVKISNKKPRLLQEGEKEKGAQQLKVEVKETQESSSSPLDLTHRSPNSLNSDPEEDGQAKSPRADQPAPGTRSPEQKLGPEIEAQLNFLKVKQMEFLKQAAEQSVNRCNECNINFSKYQNYLAHKKYYCSGLKQGQTADSDEDSTHQSQAKPKTLSPSAAPSSSSSSSPPFSSASPASTNKTIFSREFFQKSLLDAPKLPPGLLLAPGALPPPQPSSHFVCQGCGIKFKSISNLQAHQSRYCAGIKTPEEVNVHQPPSLEALLKSGLGQLPIQGMSAADMMSFLSAQQALKAEAKEGRLVEESEARSPKSEGEDFCCILCGFKESSVDKLKDHINMHFIGQVKKRKSENEGSLQGEEMADKENRQEVLVKRIKVEGKQQQEEENGELGGNSDPLTGNESLAPSVKESQTALTCGNCSISFVNPSTYSAHVQFYCKKKTEPV